MTGTDHTGKAGSGGELHMQAMAFPTPTAKDADGSRDTSMNPGSKRNKGRTLTDATMELWQTPATDSFRSRGGERKDEQGLDQQAREWPTPRVRSTLGDTASAEREKEGPCPGLNDAAASWATPTTADKSTVREQTKGGRSLMTDVAKWPTPRGEDSESCGNHPGAQDSLSGATKSWPTPTGNPEAPNLNSNQVNGESSLGAAAEKWPTPNVPNGGRGMKAEDVRAKGATVQGKRQVDLGAKAKIWPTPSASLMNDGESPENFQKRADRLEEKHGNTNGAGIPLPVAAAAWPTPRADSKSGSRTPNGNPAKDGRILDQVAKEWPTPTATDSEDAGKKGEKHGLNLPEATKAWPTPNSRDHKGSDLSSRNGGASLSHFAETGERTHGNLPSSPQVPVISAHGGELSPTDPSTASRRRLNPAFVCWLMGWPWWWTNPGEINSAREATESYLCRLRTLLSSLLGERDSSR